MGSGLWSVEFVKLEGESWTDGIGRSGAVQKHETFRGHVEFWGPGPVGGRGCFFRTLRIFSPKSVICMVSQHLRNEGKFDTGWNQHTELVVQMYLQHNGILWNTS